MPCTHVGGSWRRGFASSWPLSLRAAHGVGVGRTQLRLGQPQRARGTWLSRTVAGVDNLNPLAYMDYSQLLEIIAHALGSLCLRSAHASGVGRQAGPPQQIRHRIGHLRRPHPDDLYRLEHPLRDLERGAFVAYASYNDRDTPEASEPGTVVDGWVQGHHPTARRLITPPNAQYETHLVLETSRRPWASTLAPGATSINRRGRVRCRAEFLTGRTLGPLIAAGGERS